MVYAIVGAVLIGLSLGLLGSGGSILTVPVLVYLLGRPEKLAIAESLAIVGGIALVGVVQYAWRRQTQWRYVLWFGVPGMGGAYAGALVARAAPGALQLTVFAVVMLAAAWGMLRNSRGSGAQGEPAPHPLTGAGTVKAVLLGAGVGLMTGFVGVGGGFLIVPALVLLVGMPMRGAVGTSLAIITLNSVAGFLKHRDVLPALGMHPDWPLIWTFIAIGGVGSVVGGVAASRIDQRRLRRGFAVFLVLMGVFILVREAPQLVPKGPEGGAEAG